MKPEERRAIIVEAAASCFAERGYHATQVSDIIDRAGIARGTFYLYFKSKHDLFSFILDDFIRHLHGQIKNIELGAAESPSVQLRRNVERVVDAILDRPALGKIIFNEAVGLDAETDGQLREFSGKLIDLIASSIRRGVSIGLVRRVDPQLAACAVLGSLREALVQSTVFRTIRIGRDALIEGLIDILIGGLGGKPVLM